MESCHVLHVESAGIRKASQTVRNISWFEVGEIRGQVVDGDIAHVQVTLKIGFRVED